MNDSPRPELQLKLTRRIVEGLTIDVALALCDEPGVLFGPSGAGKTSLLRLVAGLEKPDSGFIRLGDAVLFDSSENIHIPLRRRRIGMIFQDDLLFPHLSVRENVAFGLKGLERTERRRRLAETVELCGVAGLLDRRPGTLSGGERQRVGLARALAPRPRLLLCDEPVSALDLDGRDALLERLRTAAEVENIPLLYVTHDPDEAIVMGTTVFAIRDGTIVARGNPLDILTEYGRVGGPNRSGPRNLFAAVVERQDDPDSTVVRLQNGPALTVPKLRDSVGARLTISIRSQDVLLARGSIAGVALSARNVLEGIVEKIATRGSEAEAAVRCQGALFLAGVTAPAVRDLDLRAGSAATLIVKARSCAVIGGGNSA